MKNRVLSTIALAMFVSTSGVWATQPTAILSLLKGKVEVKALGSKVWAPAVEGQELSPSTTLSTGFDSSVVVTIDKNTIHVKPLTRLTIDKLVEDSGVVKTTTFLRVGSVSASVKSAEGLKQDFKVQSPYSTASVRGTEFDYDGLRLRVREGLVAMVLGRPQREKQTDAPLGTEAPAEEDQTSSEPAVDEDFAGSPDVPADETNVVSVGAGKDVKVEVNYSGGSSSTSGSASNQGAEEPKKGSTAEISKPVTRGKVKLTITFQE